jgi:chromosomal replication initiation ATPase DnaA
MKQTRNTGEDRARARLVMHLVAAALGVSVEQMQGDTRMRPETAARAVAYYITRTAFGMSLARVAAAFRRDRSTVAHACARLEERREDARFDRWMEALEASAMSAPMPMAEHAA